MKKNKHLKKAMPWLLIVFGFLTLNMFQGYVALACMVIGIVMIIERIWPEKWDNDNKNSNSVEKQQL
jgi:hypothetical protein